MKYRVTYKCRVEGTIYETYETEAPNIETAEEIGDLGNFVECTSIEVDKYIDSEINDIELIKQ